MAEYTANGVQTVNPGESVVFTESPEPCNRGLVKHRDGTGSFLLSGWSPNRCRCRCAESPNYLINFGANIAVPETGSASEISLAIAIDGATVPASQMVVTPSAVNVFDNVCRARSVDVWKDCCETVTVRNTSDQPILVQNANIIITRSDLATTY